MAFTAVYGLIDIFRCPIEIHTCLKRLFAFIFDPFIRSAIATWLHMQPSACECGIVEKWRYHVKTQQRCLDRELLRLLMIAMMISIIWMRCNRYKRYKKSLRFQPIAPCSSQSFRYPVYSKFQAAKWKNFLLNDSILLSIIVYHSLIKVSTMKMSNWYSR